MRIAVRLTFIACPMLCAAATPEDFTHAWTIQTTTANSAYSIELPEDAILASQHRWQDVAVLDAHGTPMQFTISDGVGDIAMAQTTPLKCALQTTTAIPSLIYHCDSVAPIANALGARVQLRGFRSKFSLRDDNGAILANIDGGTDAMIPGSPGVPVEFDHALAVSALTLESFTPGVDLIELRVVSPPVRATRTQWRAARLLRTEPDRKRYIYATDFAARAFGLRLGFDKTDPLRLLTLMGCGNEDCSNPDTNSVTTADALMLGPGNPSFPVLLGTFGSNQPYMRVDSKHPLDAPPAVEIGWVPPKLTFLASGAQPYTLAIGQSAPPTDARYRWTIQNNMPGFQSTPAPLLPYSHAARVGSLLIDLAGPGLLVLALGIGCAWALWPAWRRRAGP